LGIIENPLTVKLNATLVELIATNIEALFWVYKNIFTLNYIKLKGIP
jgi:hypothetical protein